MLLFQGIFISFFLFLFQFLHGENAPSCMQEPEPISLVNMSSGPASCVNGAVNVITGDYIEQGTEAILSGVEPYVLGHTYYSSTSLEEVGSLAHGWNFNHCHLLQVFQPKGINYTKSLPEEFEGPLLFKGSHSPYDEKNPFTHLFVEQPGGSKVLLKGNGWASHFEVVLKKTGYTNVASEMSGKTSIKNIKAKIDKDHDRIEVTTGDGTIRSYRRRWKQKEDQEPGEYNYHFRDYQIVEEKKPSGNRVLYEYSDRGDIVEIKTVNKHKSHTLNWVKFKHLHYKDWEKNPHLRVVTSDGHEYIYHHKKVEGSKKHGTYVVKEIERSGFPSEKIEYSLESDDHDTRIKRKTFKDGNSIEMRYWRKGHNEVVDGHTSVTISVHDSWYKKFVEGRVRTQLSPIGIGGELVITHGYRYSKPAHDKSGKTTVYDAEGNTTEYFYDKHKRLTRIEKTSSDKTKQYMAEEFTWGDDKDEGNLRIRTLFDEHNKAVFSKHYTYDDAGNVIKERCYGDFTGLYTDAIHLRNDGYPEEMKLCDIQEYRYTYSDDGLNLKLSEEDPLGNFTYYKYVHGTNLIEAIFQCTGKKISKRQFFEYDDNAVVIEKIVDDGVSKKRDSLDGVTERHCTRITPRKELPNFGAPKTVREFYLNLKTRKELLLYKTVYHYNKRGLVAKKDLYDEKDELKASCHYRYDKNDRLILSKDPLGKIEYCKYDSFGRVIYRRGPRHDFKTYYQYDIRGNLIKEREVHNDGLELTTLFRYDILGRKVATISPQGHETSFEYDAANRLTKIVYPKQIGEDGHFIKPTKTYHYSRLGKKVVETNERGYETAKIYNVQGKLLQEIFPDGNFKKYTYDLLGNKIKEETSSKFETQYSYDIFGNITSIVEEWPVRFSKKRFTYNSFHLLSEESSTGQTTCYHYDYAGRKISEEVIGKKEEKGSKKKFKYDSLSRLIEERLFVNTTDFLATRYKLNIVGQTLEQTQVDTKGTILSHERYAYDAEGNVIETKTPIMGKLSSTRTTFFPHKIPHKTIDALGNVTKKIYDYYFTTKRGQQVLKITTINPQGMRQEEVHDVQGRVVKTECFDPFGHKLSKKKFIYDPCGNLIITRETPCSTRGEEPPICTRLSYDSCNRLKKIEQALFTLEQKTVEYVYNRFGEKIFEFHPDGISIKYQYDHKGRLVQFFANDKSVDYSYTYDKADRIRSVTNNILQTKTVRKYDSFGRLATEIQENGLNTSYEYDFFDRLTHCTLPDASSLSYLYSPGYLHQVIRCDSQGTQRYCYSVTKRDSSGKIITAELPGKGGSLSHRYDLLGRLTRFAHPSLLLQDFCYDSLSNLTHVTSTDSQDSVSHTFSYDFLSQLTEENGLQKNSYIYDSLNTRLEHNGESYEVNALRQIRRHGPTTYDYDGNGNRIHKECSDEHTTYRYDALDRLIEVEVKHETRALYTYDAFNRRMDKTLFSYHNATWEKTTHERYLFQDQNEIGMVDDAGTLQQFRVLAYGLGAEIGATVALELYGKTVAPIHDFRGNISTLVDLDGNVVESYRYTAFGTETIYDSAYNITTTSSLGNPWRFSSKRVDDETGLVFFGRRYYDPIIGNWLTQDPLGLKDGPNPYAYVHNNPLTHFDLYGLFDFGGICDRVCDFFSSCYSTISSWCSSGYDCVRDAFFGRSDSSTLSDGERRDRPEPVTLDSPAEKKDFTNGAWYSCNGVAIRQMGNTTNPVSDIVVMNGMSCHLREAEQQAEQVANNAPDARVTLVRNGSHGWFFDLIECTLGRFGIATAPAKAMAKVLQDIHDSAQDKTKVIFVVSFSQGAIHTNNALKLVGPDVANKVAVLAMGPGKIISNNDCRGAVNLVSTRDPVPFTDPIGMMSKNTNVVFLTAQKGAGFFDHAFKSPTYQQGLQYHLGNFMKKYGDI